MTAVHRRIEPGRPPDGAAPAPNGPTSAGQICALIRSRPGWTRQQLLTATGMSRTTLFERLDLLFRGGFVYESGSAGAAAGRPAQLLRFDDRNRVLLILDLGQLHGRIAVADLSGRTLRMTTLQLDISRPPGRLLPRLLDQADALLRVDADAQLVGVGMAIPGPVDVATGHLGESTTMPGWAEYGIAAKVRDRWGVPLLIENDARAFAAGEAAAAQDDGVVVGVKYSSGIGAGVVVHGEVIEGADGAAGDIGHIRVSDDGPQCTCGRRGCLAAWASGRALLGQLAPAGVANVEDLVERAQAGDPAVVAALGAAAARLGRVIAAIIATVNPDTLVLGGSLGRLDIVTAEVERRVRDDAVGRATQKLRVLGSRIGDESGTVGLSRMLVQRVYSAQAVDAALAHQG